MSYEDVDDIKDQLYNAYLTNCVFIGRDPSLRAFEVEALSTGRLKISVKIEIKV